MVRNLFLVSFLLLLLVLILPSCTNDRLSTSGGAGDGDVPDGDVPDGDAPDGDAPDGDVPDGDVPDGDVPDGDVPDGDVPDGDAPDGDAPDGDVDGDVPMPEPRQTSGFAAAGGLMGNGDYTLRFTFAPASLSVTGASTDEQVRLRATVGFVY